MPVTEGLNSVKLGNTGLAAEGTYVLNIRCGLYNVTKRIVKVLK
jgi:hypothetical protein